MQWQEISFRRSGSQWKKVKRLLLLRGRPRRGARNHNLQVTITHEQLVFNQHSFGLPLQIRER